MDYLVTYASNTGNTQKVAMEIFEALPGKSKDIISLEEFRGQEADTYFAGFWNNRGTCPSEVIDFLSSLHGKRVALFGTCAIADNEEYYRQVEKRVSVFVPDDNEYLGCFMCAGRMGAKVLERYRQMQALEDTPRIRAMIAAFEKAMLHPDEQDFKHAREFVKQALEK